MTFQEALDKQLTPAYQKCFGKEPRELLRLLYDVYEILPGDALAATFLHMFDIKEPHTGGIYLELEILAKMIKEANVGGTTQ